VEDSRWGLESAKTAGLRTVGVTSSYGAAELALADLVIPSLAELDLSRLRQLLS
jgi:beta-phosphoglucomutase-like phosphatase (HAD superfamily)